MGVIHSFSFRRFGDLAASIMALECCRRMEHHYQISLAQDEDLHHYSAVDLTSYVEDLAWVDFPLRSTTNPPRGRER